MKQKLNFNDALELLLRGEKIYSEVSKCTFLLDDDTIFITCLLYTSDAADD